MFDKVLTIPQPEHLGQTTGWFCGPATCQTTLQILGDFYEEEQLANEMGTTQDGTNHIGLLANCLNSHAHHAKWEAVFIENDPMNADQKEQFWTHLTASLTAGFPCPMNWVAPPGGTPIAVDPNTGQPTAEQPGYSNAYTTFHYVLARGAIENDKGRFVAVADSGFWPQQYYVKFEGQGSATSLIPPKGYVWATAAPIGVPTLPGPPPAPAAPAAPAPAAPQGIPCLIGRNGPKPVTVYSVDEKVSNTAHEVTMYLPGRTLRDGLAEVITNPGRVDTSFGHSINAASLARINFELMRRLCEHLKIDISDVV